MTKGELASAIFGRLDGVTFDTAVPQDWLDNAADTISGRLDLDRSDVYHTLRAGCVTVYENNLARPQLLFVFGQVIPITIEAVRMVELLENP